MHKLLTGVNTRIGSACAHQRHWLVCNGFNGLGQVVLYSAAMGLGLPTFKRMTVVTQAQGHPIHLVQAGQKRLGFANLVGITLAYNFIQQFPGSV